MRNSELWRPDDDSALKMEYTDNVSLYLLFQSLNLKRSRHDSTISI